jgi:hypothetical protein
MEPYFFKRSVMPGVRGTLITQNLKFVKMKINPQIFRYSLIAFISGTLFTACKKEGSENGNSAEQKEFATASMESDSEAEVVYDDVFNNVIGVNSEVAIGGTGVFAGRARRSGEEVLGGVAGADSSTCYAVSVVNLNQGSVFPVQVTIDFGAGCTGKDGRVRKGKVNIVYSNRLIFPGATATTTFDNHYVNGVKVEGTHKIINTSTNNQLSFQVLVEAGKLTRESGATIQWNSEKNFVMTTGLSTPLMRADDTFQVTGEANGSVQTANKLYQWSTTITEPLVKTFTCRWISDGVITLKKNGETVATLDYGNGDCDKNAVLSVAGQTVEISLR